MDGDNYGSLIAAYLFILYGILQNDYVIILGQAMAYIIYVRNLQLEGSWTTMPVAFRIAAIFFPLITIAWLFIPGSTTKVSFELSDFLYPIVMTGAIGQLLLNFRFLYQWYYAEKVKTPVLPLGFWIMTAAGSIMTVCYAVYRFDPVLLFAQGLGLIAALRNIQLHFKTVKAN